MRIKLLTNTGKINNPFIWFHKPPQHKVENGRLHVTTAPNTDFWQGTYYGFHPDSGHCLLTKVTEDFSLSVRTEFFPQKQYDQCGLIVRGDEKNWIKASTEYENNNHSRLGSVVTNNGWSDWATTDVSSNVQVRWYQIQSRLFSSLKDFLIEYSDNGISWHQIRVAHLHGNFDSLSVGIYACSPNKTGGFEAIFDNFALAGSQWINI
jgi:hypothetical protein